MTDDRGGAVELIVLRKAEIGYQRPILPPLDLTVRTGQRIAILGPNGAGKSTLLRTLSGVLPVLSGTLAYPLGRRPTLGYVPQSHQLDPAFPLTAHAIVLMGCYRGLGVARRVRPADREAASRALARVGLAGQGSVLYRKLSGGQRQRTLLARALVGSPEILALDEPTSELDPGAEHEFLALVDAVSAEQGTCVIVVTHQINAAAKLATDIVLIHPTSGRVEQGPVEAMLSTEQLAQLYGLPTDVARAVQAGLRVRAAPATATERS